MSRGWNEPLPGFSCKQDKQSSGSSPSSRLKVTKPDSANDSLQPVSIFSQTFETFTASDKSRSCIVIECSTAILVLKYEEVSSPSWSIYEETV